MTDVHSILPGRKSRGTNLYELPRELAQRDKSRAEANGQRNLNGSLIEAPFQPQRE